MEEESGMLDENYMVIAKPVTGLTTLTGFVGVEPSFSEGEIAALEQHPSVVQVGRFVTANFNLRGSFALGGMGISTEMFLESVPSQFLDVEVPRGVWDADLDSEEIPIIIPRRYLNIYNFGYASTKGLPKVSEGLTSKFPLRLRLEGNGKTASYKARIVGYTDRLNTILAPETFLRQANEKFAKEADKPSTRLVVKTDLDRGGSSFLEFLDERGYVIEGDAENARLKTLVHGVLWVVIGIGGIVSLLAFFLLLISVQLLIEKNKDKFINLSSLGYSVRQIATPYLMLVVGANGLVWLIAVAVVSIAYPCLFDFISAISPELELASMLPLWGIAAGFAAVFSLLHRWVIVSLLRGICK
jgi:hypothetical protein